MKTTLTILLSGLLVCGCAQNRASSAGPAINLVQAGKDTVWQNGTVLHIAKREGTSVEGIQIVRTSEGQKMTVTADTGTLSPGTIQNAADADSIKLILRDARSETLGPSGRNVMTVKEWTLVLKR
jgi:hypothetical protein